MSTTSTKGLLLVPFLAPIEQTLCSFVYSLMKPKIYFDLNLNTLDGIGNGQYKVVIL